MTDLTPETIANLRESQRPMEQEFAVVIAALLAGRCDGKQAVASATAIHVREVTRLRADLAEARGDSPAGFMSQREWEDWSNELAMLIPEDDMHGNPEGAQESIILATLSGWYGELVEARAVIEQIESLAKIQAISCQAAHRADHARNWLDVLAIIERSALAPATQREEGV